MAEVLHVRLLGGFDVSADGRTVPVTAWRLRKAKTLVKLLALEPGHAVHRDRVIDALWPDIATGANRNNLHQVVHATRKALSHVGFGGASGVAVQGDLLVLCAGAEVRTDLRSLQEQVRSAVGAGRADEAARLLLEAAPDLLPEDRYEAWAAAHVAQFHEWRTQVVMELVESELATGEPGKAVVLLAPVLGAEPLHEPATRGMMRALAATGRRSEALLLYERLRSLLRDELAAEPEEQTRLVFRDLLTTAPGADPRPIPAPRAAGNLPAPMTPLIGRSRELVETKAILDRVRLLTVTGLGGAGKTTLAVELARRAAPDFGGHVHLVELGALDDGEQVAPRIAHALRLDLPSDAPPVEALAAQLRHQRMLLLVDNCEHLLDACARVVGELLRTCPDLRVLATSREPLRIEGEVSWQTPSLELPDLADKASPEELAAVASVELFVQRAAAVVPGFTLTEANAAAVAEICYRLDGIPLALELAAACIPMSSPAEIAARLGDSLNLLRRGSRTGITRQQTLEATLTWSHDLLAADERILFRRLAVFAGPFTFHAAEAVCNSGLADSAVLSSLARLVDTSLVVVEVRSEVTRYRLLETVRQYAAQQLRAAAEQNDVADRHCLWYLRFAEERDPERSPVPLAVLPADVDIEHDNLRAALRWALVHRPPTSLQIATALWRYWLARGLLAEGRAWIESALSVNPEPSALRARALIALAVFDVRRGTDRRLAELGAEAVSIHRATGGAWEGLAQALHSDAVLAYMRGNWDEAWSRSNESAEVATDAGIPQLHVAARHLQAIVLMGRGRLAEAHVAFDEVADSLVSLDPTTRPFLPPVLLGFSVENRTTPAPRLYFEETVLLGRLAGVEQARAYVLCNLADLARLDGDLDQSLRLLHDASRAFAAQRDLDGEALAFSRRGCVHRARAEFTEGAEALEHSLTLRRIVGDRRGIGLALSNQGVLAVAAGDPQKGRALINEALRAATEMQDGAAQAGLTLTLASVCADTQQYDESEQLLRRALLDSLHIPGNARAYAWGHAVLCDVLQRLGREADAARAADVSTRALAALGAVERPVSDLPAPVRHLLSRG